MYVHMVCASGYLPCALVKAACPQTQENRWQVQGVFPILHACMCVCVRVRVPRSTHVCVRVCVCAPAD
jgi:hypothetical protein